MLLRIRKFPTSDQHYYTWSYQRYIQIWIIPVWMTSCASIKIRSVTEYLKVVRALKEKLASQLPPLPLHILSLVLCWYYCNSSRMLVNLIWRQWNTLLHTLGQWRTYGWPLVAKMHKESWVTAIPIGIVPHWHSISGHSFHIGENACRVHICISPSIQV